MRWTKNQQSAIEKNKNNLLVSASAGSGKTAVLVERIVQHILSGGDVRRLVVMTFTKDSAKEMRERVLVELYKNIRLQPENVHLKEQADVLPFSNITTIDGYCLQLVKRYFNELGEEATVDMLAEEDAKILLFKATDAAIDGYFEAGGADFFELLDKFIENRDVQVLKDTICDLHRFLGVQAEREAFLVTVRRVLATPFPDRETTSYFLAEIRSRAARYAAEMEAHFAVLPHTEPAFCALIAATLAELKELSTVCSVGELCRTALSIVSTELRFGFSKTKKEAPEEYEKLQNIRDAAKDFLKELRASYADEAELQEKEAVAAGFSQLLLEIALATDKQYKALKREAGKLDFNDVEQLAYRILADNARREEISAEIDFLYLDEYQDTNYLQEGIVSKLSRGGNIFMVGDPKQAIYRFRLAEPKIFVGKYHKYSVHDGGDKVDLNDNFRSDPRILDFVNMLFGELMTDRFGGVNYRASSELTSGNELLREAYQRSGLPAVEVCLYEVPRKSMTTEPLSEPYSVQKDGDGVREKRDENGERIARKITDILGRPIFEPKTSLERGLTYGDICVITPSNKQVSEIARTLAKHGIPSISSGKGNEDENLDIKLLHCFLRAADNLENDIPLVTVMVSPLGNFSEEELSAIRLNAMDKTFWEAVIGYSGDKTIEIKIKTLLCRLSETKLRSGYLTVKQLLQYVTAETEFVAYLMGQADGAERLTKLNIFLCKLEGKESQFRLKEYLAECDLRETGMALPALDGDAVRVMTLHGSKGLEFPVVFVAHADEGYRKDARSRSYFDKEFGVAVKYFNAKNNRLEDTIFTTAFRMKAETEEKEEKLRLMYVALTRAKNHLYVVGKRKKTAGIFVENGKNFAEWFCYALEKNGDLIGYLHDFPTELEESIEEIQENTENSSCDFSLCGLDAPYRFYKDCELGTKYTVSELNTSQDEDFVPTYVLQAHGGRDEGILYHKILENIDFFKTSEEEIEEELARMETAGILTEDARQDVSVSQLAQILRGEIFQSARNGTVKREQPFMLYVPACEVSESTSKDKILVQGVIDLFILGKENIVVDYKNTAMSAASCLEKYRKQVLLYALAAERILGIKVQKRFLYIINRNEIIEV